MDGTVQTTQVELKGEIVYIPEVDKTLTKDGYSADAKVTGERLDILAEQIGEQTNPSASNINFDNAGTSLKATTVQSAITEVAGKVEELGVGEEKLTELENDINTLETSLETLENNVVKNNDSSMIKGTLMVQNADNGYGSVMKNNSESADYGTQLADVSKSGKTAKITVNALSNLLTFTDSGGEIRDIFHEGNKQFRSYVGNGFVTYAIEINSIGRLAIVYGDENLALVTPKGALTIKLSDGSMVWLDGSIMYYLDGVLFVIGTDAVDRFNRKNELYYIQAI